jgi:hypothetical protein
MTPFVALALLALTAGQPLAVRWPPGTLHGFPSLSDAAGAVIADGELTQELRGEALAVVVRWRFADGRRVEERDEFRTGANLVQRRFSWIEKKRDALLRRFEVDFSTGRALAFTRDEKGQLRRDEETLDLAGAPAFAGYGTSLAITQLGLAEGDEAEIRFVAFTPKPRAVTLGVRRDRPERVGAAGRLILCDRFTLHPKIPFPVSLFAGAKDAHLWFTHAPPPALVRAEQNLIVKDDPTVIVDVVPRGSAAHAQAARLGAPGAHRPRR